MPESQDDWAAKLEHLHRAAIAVAGAHDVNEALQTIADAARELVGAEMSAIGVPGEPGEPMAHFIVSGLSPQAVEQAGTPPMGRGVLGELLKEGKPVMTDNIRSHAAYQGIPPRHPVIESFLGIPIQSQGEILGDLYLANKLDGDGFTEEDFRLAEMLAAHAAVVIQTLRYHRQQEALVLIHARARLAPKIEDDVLQALYGAGLLLTTLDLDQPGSASEQIRDIQSRLDAAISHLREHLLHMTNAQL